MKYVTITECARKWGVSERRVAQLCNGGQIDGAIKQRRFWLIPEDAQKPADGRVAPEGSIAAGKRKAESMRNNVFAEDSLLQLHALDPESVDLIMSEIPLREDGSGRKPLSVARLWSEYHRIIKPEGCIVLLTSGTSTADIIASNEKEFRYKLVWAKNSKDSKMDARGSSHMDVCVFSAQGEGKVNEDSILDALGKGLFHMDGTGDVLRFTDQDGNPLADDGADKMALGSFIACAYTEPRDFIVDNAGYTGKLIAGAMFAGRNVCCIERDAQRSVQTEEGKAFMGLPGDVAFQGVPQYPIYKKDRTVTEYYANSCWNSLLDAYLSMPDDLRSLLDPSPLTADFDRALAYKRQCAAGAAAETPVPDPVLKGGEE